MTVYLGSIIRCSLFVFNVCDSVVPPLLLWLTGVLTLEGAARQSVTMDVMPLAGGFLPLPSVRLSKYIPADAKHSTSRGNSIYLIVFSLSPSFLALNVELVENVAFLFIAKKCSFLFYICY